jgi:hypothetical protein
MIFEDLGASRVSAAILPVIVNPLRAAQHRVHIRTAFASFASLR